MSNLRNKLIQLRHDAGLSQTKLAEQLKVSKALISKIEKGYKISDKLLLKYSDFFSIPLEELRKSDSEENSVKVKNMSQLVVPHYCSISAGMEQPLVENIPDKYIPLFLTPGSYTSKDNIVTVDVNGESMNKIVPNHSTLILDKGGQPKNGNIVAYQLDGDFGIKRFFETPNDIFLIPESYNNQFKTKSLSKDNLHNREFYIIGKMIGFFQLGDSDYL